jgi:lysophospholipase L1-like esterase
MREIVTRSKRAVRHFLTIATLAVLLTLVLTTSAEAALSWKYTALGDSLAVGLWAAQGYVPRYRADIQTDTSATVGLTNLGKNGWTSSQLLNALKTNSTFRNAVAGSQVVTWDIGGNDFLHARERYKAKTCGGIDNQACIRSAVATFKSNWNAIIAEILNLRSPSDTIIRTMNLYNPYVNRDKAANTWPDYREVPPYKGNDFQVFKPYVDDLNSFILTSSICPTSTPPYTRCADVYHNFNGPNGDLDPHRLGYISFDGLHPNAKGHAAIADLLRALGYAPLK